MRDERPQSGRSNRGERRISARNDERIRLKRAKQLEAVKKNNKQKDEITQMFDGLMNAQVISDQRKQREQENPLFRAVG